MDKTNNQISKHPYSPFIPDGADKLIIGTIPPKRFCITPQELHPDDVNFYYGSKDNAFWEIIGKVFEWTFDKESSNSCVEQRKGFLKEHKLGITDLIDECVHKNGLASDNDLSDIKYRDIAKLLKENCQITTLIYTSDFVKQKVNHIFDTHHAYNEQDKKRFVLKIGDRVYDVKVLYSPSPQALRNMGPDGDERRKKQYAEFLGQSDFFDL